MQALADLLVCKVKGFGPQRLSRLCGKGMLHGYVKIGMEAKAQGALEAFNRPGSKWKVDFAFAEPNDNEP